MQEMLRWLKSLSAVLGWFLGGFDGFLYILIAFVIVDYVTGIVASIVEKTISSEVGFKGIARKVVIFLLVGIGHLLDKEVLGVVQYCELM